MRTAHARLCFKVWLYTVKNIKLQCLALYLDFGFQERSGDVYLRLETHVNHSVCFIKDDIVALIQHRVALLHAVLKPSRCGNHDFATLPQFESLLTDILPTHDADCAIGSVLGELDCLLLQSHHPMSLHP